MPAHYDVVGVAVVMWVHGRVAREEDTDMHGDNMDDDDEAEEAALLVATYRIAVAVIAGGGVDVLGDYNDGLLMDTSFHTPLDRPILILAAAVAAVASCASFVYCLYYRSQ